jgi:Fe2+ or Zn2+ uptake regulation protein
VSSHIKLESEAYRSLADLLDRAEKTRSLFEQAGVSLPDALQRLVRRNGHLAGTQMAIPALKPPAPPEAEADWIWVEQTAATPGTMALALLRASETMLTVRELHEKMRAMGIDVSLGTIANTGTRAYENELITRSEDGHWKLRDPNKAAILHEGYLWGKAEAFQMSELASHRRRAVVHVLRQNQGGLQQSQILAQLRQKELVQPGVPLNKTLIRADLEAMASRQVRQISNSRKWEAI